MALPIHDLAPDAPHTDLGTLPTPVTEHPDLGAAIGVPELYVKRDGQSGALYGGNKLRKLEFLLADAADRDCTAVWTGGGIGSNHVLATCLYAREESLSPCAVQFPQPVDDHVRENLRALATTDPELKLVSSEPRAALSALRLKLARRLHPSPSFYYVPPGGAAPVGELGYVNAALELERQVAAGDLPPPEVVGLAVGTGGTIAGLLVGLALTDLDPDVLGIRVADRLFGNAVRVARLGNRTASLLADLGVDSPPRLSPRDVTIVDGYVGAGYGSKTTAGRRAKAVAAEHGLELDGTYTAKALAGLCGERDRRDLADRRVLFVHTHNEADISERVAAAAPSADLPEPYHRFFEADAD